ncbi:hypothetical protein [Caballeronia sp.]|uniref:hypothetical protein n=1 Tax=Caballeronia sp. TaxID=1931223 RepID=UPI002629F39C|nr:hypothetical protein [Caballeronia sp.]
MRGKCVTSIGRWIRPGQTVAFMPRARREVAAARSFFTRRPSSNRGRRIVFTSTDSSTV